MGKVEKYPSLELKAAALFHSLATGHPFHNGNKRTALVATLAFLERNDRRFSAGDDELFDFVLAVANRSMPFEGAPDDVVERIANWLYGHLLAERGKVHGMRFKEFLDRCEEAGCTYRQTKKGESWVIRGLNGKSIRISCSTKRLDGGVVRTYLNRLGLSEASSGIHQDEFQEGIDPEQYVIRKFRAVLNRLAHA